MIKVASESEVEVDAIAHQGEPYREQGALGIEGAALAFQEGNDIDETLFVLLKTELLSAAGLGHSGGKSGDL